MPAVSSVQCEEEWNKYCTLWGPGVSSHYSRPFNETNRLIYPIVKNPVNNRGRKINFYEFLDHQMRLNGIKTLEKSKNINPYIQYEVSLCRHQATTGAFAHYRLHIQYEVCHMAYTL